MEQQTTIDFLWMVCCSCLVFVMQAGFLCREGGLTGTKYGANVAAKSLAGFCLTTVVFWAVGFGIMFGTTRAGWAGTTGSFLDLSNLDRLSGAFFLLQTLFCGVAAAIVSGAVAGRMRLSSHLIVAVIIAALIYPVFGHWAWSGLDEGAADGWLNALGFVDFAGSTVVHGIGGWASLAVLLVIGPRRGQFSAGGKPRSVPPSSLTLATLGSIFLFIGWLGFNGGNTLALNGDVSRILVNTVIAGSVGTISAGLLGCAVQQRSDGTQFNNGCLAGLVAITAGCFAVSTPVAALIGLVGGMIAVGVQQALERLRIDDAVGAIPVHLAAGIWGTLAVGLYADLDVLGTGLTRMGQIGVQMLGVAVCGAWTLGVMFVALRTVNFFHHLRVVAEDEELGMDCSEHSESEGHENPGAPAGHGEPSCRQGLAAIAEDSLPRDSSDHRSRNAARQQ